MRLQTLPFLTILFLSPLIWADVNMKDGGFLNSDRDGFIHRTYNSRSMSSGWLGFGWCSNLEKRLRIQDGRITYLDCNLDREISFYMPKAGGKSKSENFILQVIGTQYLLTKRSDSPISKVLFNSQGQLTELTENGRGPIQIRYLPTGRIKDIVDETQRKSWHVTWSKDEKIIGVSTEGDDNITYSYSNDNLIQVNSNLGLRSSLKYNYDSFHNLQSIQRSGKIENRLTYDTDHDRLLSQQKSETCLEIYKYSSSSDLHFSSSAERYCGKSKPQIRTYEFWQKDLSEGFHLLMKMKITTGNQQRQYQYDALTDAFVEIHPTKKIGVLND